MVGALEAKDDVKAEEILADLRRNYVQGDADILLLSDPAIIDYEAVNAFQRYSSVILQRSILEGFGFTVTEAMWKKQPVVGTALLHQKSYPAVCSTGIQEPLAVLSAGELGAGDGLRSTSACYCSSKVCEPGGHGFCAYRAVRCGSATVDSVQGRGAATPGRSLHRSVRGWQPARTGSAPALLQGGLSESAASPGCVFSFPALGRGYGTRLPAGPVTLLSMGAFPIVQRSTEKTRMGTDGVFETKGAQLTAQRKTACCNCSSCWKRRKGSSVCATSVSACCFWADRTPDRSNRSSGVLDASKM
jgi:hypothetical protein